MSWEIVEHVGDEIAIWWNGEERHLSGLPYAVGARRQGFWVEPTRGEYQTLKAAREAARERIAEADGRLRDLQQAAGE